MDSSPGKAEMRKHSCLQSLRRCSGGLPVIREQRQASTFPCASETVNAMKLRWKKDWVTLEALRITSGLRKWLAVVHA